MSDNLLPERTPDEIRDDAMKVFNQMAPAKYDDGQARQIDELKLRSDKLEKRIAYLEGTLKA